jgi:hypothetical protein
MHAGDEGNRGGTVQFYTKGLQSWLKGCDTRIEHIAKKGAPAGSTEQHTPRDCSMYAFCGSVLPHCVYIRILIYYVNYTVTSMTVTGSNLRKNLPTSFFKSPKV